MYENMLNLNLKAKNIKRRLLSTHKARDVFSFREIWLIPRVVCLKRGKEYSKASRNRSQLDLGVISVRATSAPEAPSVDDLLLKKTELNAREEALELEKTLFHQEKAAWMTNMTAQKKKQALIRQGATIMFRTHRLEAQQEMEQHEKNMHALEDGLLQTAQQELDLINQEHAEAIGNLLAATAAQATCAAASLDAKARANAISDRLIEALDKVHHERLHIAELTEKVNVKFAELDVVTSIARTEGTEAHKYLQRAQSHASRFSLAAEAIELVQGQIESHAIQYRERLSITVDKERSDALAEARSETQKRLAALKDARTAFEKLREAEKANLAKGYARVEHSRAVVDMEKELVKKEMVRARLLAIKAEQERASSVDAKKAALDELQAARLMRDESRKALHKLVAIADEMAIPKATSYKLIKTMTSNIEDGQMNAKAQSSEEGMMSRFGFHIGNRRASLQGQVNGATSSIDGIEGGKASGLPKRCTSLNIRREDGSRSSMPSAITRPYLKVLNSACSEAETASTSHLIDVTTVKSQILCQKPNVAADANPTAPVGKGHDLSPFQDETTERLRIDQYLEPSTERCDKQSGRMKLGSIGNVTTY